MSRNRLVCLRLGNGEPKPIIPVTRLSAFWHLVILSSCHLVILSLPMVQARVARAGESSAPLFDVYTADGGIIASQHLEHMSDDWSVSLGGRMALPISGRDLIALRQSATPLPPPSRDEHIVLTNGDQLAGTPLNLNGERVRFNARLGREQELILPLSAISLLWFAAPDGVEDAALLHRRLTGERRRRDTALLRNGDVVEGTLTALDSGVVQIDSTSGKAVKLARDQIAVLALSTELARPRRPKGVYGRLVLANGGRLSLLSARADEQILVGQATFGATVQVPLKQLIALDLRQGRAVYLSDLRPRGYEHTSYLGMRWPYTLDSSVAGHELRVGGSTYEKGIGMHSQSRLTFELGGGYQWFEAWVGLDDRSGREGSVVIEVLVDGKPRELGPVKELTGAGKPVPIRLRVAGARELTLVVLFGRHGDVQDHVNWADARLIK